MMSKKSNINSDNNALIMLQKEGLSLNCDKTIYDEYERREINKALNPMTLVIDELLFANLEFNEKQMKQIKLGITSDLPVSTYANSEINHNKMEITRGILNDILRTRYIKISL